MGAKSRVQLADLTVIHTLVTVQELQREKSQVESLQSNIPRSKSAEVTEQEQRQAK